MQTLPIVLFKIRLKYHIQQTCEIKSTLIKSVNSKLCACTTAPPQQTKQVSIGFFWGTMANNSARPTIEYYTTLEIKAVPGLKNMESPKSIAFNGASSFWFTNKKFSGLRSLCITPREWHASTTPMMTRASCAAAFSE